MSEDGLYPALVRRGMSRRSFLKFSTAMAAALALPAAYAPRIARAVEAAPRIPVIWLRGQSCGGNTEAMLRNADPSVSSLLLDVLSVEYHESLLAVPGPDAELARTAAMDRYPNGYIAVIEGAIPTGAGGAYCLVGGRPLTDIAREVCDGALATIALGSCAFDGGAPAASGGSTGAGGVRQVVTDSRLVTLPGCPMNTVNLSATIVHYLAAGALPPADMMGRPLFAYGNLIHNQCERRPHFEFGEFAVTWGDEGAQKGWCLYKVGCKGPETMANCPTARYGDGVSWNVRAGAGCVGCTTPRFWDSMLPAYRRLGSPIPFMPGVTADTVGTLMVGGIGGVAALHGTGMIVRQKRIAAAARHEAETSARQATTPAARLEAQAIAGPAVESADERTTGAEQDTDAEGEPAAAVGEPATGEPAAIAEPASIEPAGAAQPVIIDTEPAIDAAPDGDAEPDAEAVVATPAPPTISEPPEARS